MYKYCQVVNGIAHWIFEDVETLVVLKSRFAPSVYLVDITDSNPMPQEGWAFDYQTKTFYQRATTADQIAVVSTASLEEQRLIKENIIHKQYRDKLKDVKMDYIEALLLDDAVKQAAIKESFAEAYSEYKIQLAILATVEVGATNG